MDDVKRKIVSFLVDNGAIRFGNFKLKSGRHSPYFFDIGMLDSGDTLLTLGYYFADVIWNNLESQFDVIFGPAYKGIPLSLATVIAFNLKYKVDKGFLFNRKIKKKHAEKGLLIGCTSRERNSIVIIDDVFTTGETKYEMIRMFKDEFQEVEIRAVVIGLDRMEKSGDDNNAIDDFTMKTDIPVYSLISIYDILEYLHNRDRNNYERIQEYLRLHGF